MAYNILLVDDSITVRAVIKKTLGLIDIDIGEIFEAENGNQALKSLSENWIDLVFADINMPVMGGIEMIRKMKEDDMLSKTPVIIVSTEGSKTRIDQLKKDGITDYIRKPFTPEDIRRVIEKVMGGEHV